LKNRAAFTDRDGVINEMIYQPDPGIVDQPYSASKFELVPGIGAALRNMQAAGYKLVVVSNQPGVAKKHYSMATFKKMQAKMRRLLAKDGVNFDAEYYCFHHRRGRSQNTGWSAAAGSRSQGCSWTRPGTLGSTWQTPS
jgi:D-glycero-D-manno-heptose 1,7-bisphosphate phosphatase